LTRARRARVLCSGGVSGSRRTRRPSSGERMLRRTMSPASRRAKPAGASGSGGRGRPAVAAQLAYLAERAGGSGRARRVRARLHAPGHPGRPPRRSGDPHCARVGARGLDRCLEHPCDDRGVPGGVPLRPGDRPNAERALPRMTPVIGRTLAAAPARRDARVRPPARPLPGPAARPKRDRP
jgi:hypothetical protein